MCTEGARKPFFFYVYENDVKEKKKKPLPCVCEKVERKKEQVTSIDERERERERERASSSSHPLVSGALSDHIHTTSSGIRKRQTDTNPFDLGECRSLLIERMNEWMARKNQSDAIS